MAFRDCPSDVVESAPDFVGLALAAKPAVAGGCAGGLLCPDRGLLGPYLTPRQAISLDLVLVRASRGPRRLGPVVAAHGAAGACSMASQGPGQCEMNARLLAHSQWAVPRRGGGRYPQRRGPRLAVHLEIVGGGPTSGAVRGPDPGPPPARPLTQCGRRE